MAALTAHTTVTAQPTGTLTPTRPGTRGPANTAQAATTPGRPGTAQATGRPGAAHATSTTGPTDPADPAATGSARRPDA